MNYPSLILLVAAAAGVAPAPLPPLEPLALERMKAMSNYLKAAPKFSVRVKTDREVPSVSGPMLDFFSESTVEIARPNQARVATKGDRLTASLWYDGKLVTIYAETTAYYGQVAAPATIDETVEMIMTRFQTPLPIAGFLGSDPYTRMMAGVKTASDAGVVPVDGVPCRHLTFSEPEADWQVWIEEGAKPVPRRIAVRYKTEQGSPRTVTTLSDWNLAPSFPAGEFTFTPPAGSTKVDWKAGR